MARPLFVWRLARSGVFVLAIGIMVGATSLVITRYRSLSGVATVAHVQSQPQETARVEGNAPSLPPASTPTVAAAAVAPVPVRRTATRLPHETPVVRRAHTQVAESRRVAAPLADRSRTADATTRASLPPAPGDDAAPTSATFAADATRQAAVTITGCLEMSVDGNEFRLTDTEGSNAPRSRSWRSGFLKKQPAPVALVEPLDPLALRAHVGQRVSVMGLLTDRDLQLRSLRVVDSSCS